MRLSGRMIEQQNELLDRPLSLAIGRTESKAPARVVRVWLTDDHRELRGMLATMLEEEGLVCERQFDSAELLLEALRTQTPPDFAVVDINMGGMTGIEALPHIRRLAPGVRALVLSTFFDFYQETAAMRAGASGIMRKSEGPVAVARRIYRSMREPGMAERALMLERQSAMAATTCAAEMPSPSRAEAKPRSFWRGALGFWSGRKSALSQS